MEIIPEIEFPAHANALTKTYPNLKCQTNIENQSLWTVCLGKEETYIFFEKLIEEICQIFPCEYIHIGGDEHCFDDVLSLHRHYYWNVNLRTKTKEDLINLSIIKLKIEDDFLSFKFNKFVEVLYEYQLITDDDYNLATYGTVDQQEIKLIKQGLPIHMVSKLTKDGQKACEYGYGYCFR